MTEKTHFRCDRLSATLPVAQCATLRARPVAGTAADIGGPVRPGPCLGCDQWRGVTPDTTLDQLEETMTRKQVVCAECGQEGGHGAFGLCVSCYQKQKRAEKRILPPATEQASPAVEPVQAVTRTARPVEVGATIPPPPVSAPTVDEVLELHVSFSDYPGLLRSLKEVARAEYRTPELELLYLVQEGLANRSCA